MSDRRRNNPSKGSKTTDVLERAARLFAGLDKLPFEEKVKALNAIRLELHRHSPFSSEPVDCVTWVPYGEVHANDYNPNTVAPPEMKLLERSIREDGYTQPIVAWKNGAGFEVVDGFHRNRVGRESKTVRDRIHGYLPLTIINEQRADRGDRISATIRHNRARGRHRIEAMSDIVIELKRRNWPDERICRDLGMDRDEVLRLCQITGLAEMFKDREFSRSWDAVGEVVESDFEELSDDVSAYGKEMEEFRTVNTGDENRVFHTYDKWECCKAGFYKNAAEGRTKKECEEIYRNFLSDIPRLKKALDRVVTEWKNSCEHYLTNAAMNRLAWLWQASVCIETGIPAVFRGGFDLLSDGQQQKANAAALEHLNVWLKANGRPAVDLDRAASADRQMDIY